MNWKACAGPASARDLPQPARARADRVPCALEWSFLKGRAHWRGRSWRAVRAAWRGAVGRAHWDGRFGRAVRSACGDQCAHPLRDEVASAHSRRRRKPGAHAPAKTWSAVYTVGPCGSDAGRHGSVPADIVALCLQERKSAPPADRLPPPAASHETHPTKCGRAPSCQCDTIAVWKRTTW